MNETTETVTVKIANDGGITVEVNGVEGEGCHAMTRMIEQAFGDPSEKIATTNGSMPVVNRIKTTN